MSTHAGLHDPSVPPFLPARHPAGHKGTFGTVAVVGGCCAGGRTMLGAPVLAARAALRAGAGLVKLVTPAPLTLAAIAMLDSATAIAIDCEPDGHYAPHAAAEAVDRAVAHGAGCECLVVGPGLGDGKGPTACALRAVHQHDVHVVLDADALNALAQIFAFEKELRAPSVLTPHPGEFARLAKPLGLHGDPANPADRPRLAAELAQRLGCVVVLKGAGTIVSDGLRTWINTTGNDALATAGTGDVLAGLIGGLIAQFVPPPEDPRPFPMPQKPRPPGRPLDLFDAARIGVLAHGRAAEAWCTARGATSGLLAHELADHLPAVLTALRPAPGP